MRLRSVTRPLPALALFVAVLVVPSEARAETLSCDVDPIVIGNTGDGDIWAYHLATESIIWDHSLSPDPNAFDVGQDEQGRIFFIGSSGADLYRLAGSSPPYAGTAADDPGSGATVKIADRLVLPGDAVATRINSSMLGFDKYGYGYVFGLDDGGDGIELLRFDPDTTPTVVDGNDTIELEVVATGLQDAGLPSGAPSGDFFIAESTAYIAWNGDQLALVGIALTDTGTAYEYAGSVRTVGTVVAPDSGLVSGWGTAGTGGRLFLAGRTAELAAALYEARLVGGSLSVLSGIAPGPTDDTGPYGLTGNGEAVFDDCFSFARSGQTEHPMQVVCTPDPVAAGAEVTCSITGGDPSIDILWEAVADGTVFATRGVTLDENGLGTFSFVAPASAAGGPIEARLVEWSRSSTVQVSGRVTPSSLPAGGGMPAAPVVVLMLATLALAGTAGLRLHDARR